MNPSPYPPDDHLLRDLGLVSQPMSQPMSPTRILSATLLDDHRLDRAGRPSAGLLSTVIDINAGQVALRASHPRWTTTAGLAVHTSGASAVGSLVCDGQLVRAGSNLVVVRAAVYDGRGLTPDDLLDAAAERPLDEIVGARIATALLTFGRIPAEASASSRAFDPAVIARSRLEAGTAPRIGALVERMGGVITAPGIVEVEPSGYVTNSFGTVTGGVYGMLFQVAAESWDGQAVATDIEVQFLRQSSTGPVVVTAEVVRRSAYSIVCDLSARVGDTVLATGSVTLEPVPG